MEKQSLEVFRSIKQHEDLSKFYQIDPSPEKIEPLPQPNQLYAKSLDTPFTSQVLFQPPIEETKRPSQNSFLKPIHRLSPVIDSTENSVSVSSSKITSNKIKTTNVRDTLTALDHQDNHKDNKASMKPPVKKKFSFLGNAASKVKNSNGASLQIKIPPYEPAKKNSQIKICKPSIAVVRNQQT